MENRDRRQVVLGVDFGATNLKALLLDKDGQVYQRFIERSEPERGPEATLQRIVDLVKRARKESDSADLELTGVGIGACGPVNHAKGEIVESPVLPGWKNVPVRDIIKETIELPVHLDNDANLAVLGEWWKGAGEQCAVVAGLTLGTGIGGGLVINGRVYRGGWGFGAEFGHISVAQEPSCPCGGRGCLGRVASATDTLLRYQELTGAKAAPIDGILELAKLAEKGDEAAREAIRVSADYLAKATLILINCLNPHVFILAGGMALLGDVLLRPIREFIRSSTFSMVGENTRITAARLGMYSGCYGSAWLALSETQALPE
ncbi:MAG: ROK family protein [candidate division KSB1 bacterium]|nr:ROK family protein [candidate division KSB1 bacterium]MDZ7302521.1 ROK family protein [candidate division KSB1 bacterium]MDZ7311884.1 ROK family protein [candidate division KSB1 bacterium]